jgi:hypothetical protein
LLVLLLDHINFRVEHVDVVVEGVVLFFGLDESGHNFQQIKQQTGIASTEEIVTTFIKAEE